MKRTVEFTGKKVQDTVSEGLKTLGITLDDADISIIAQGGLFKKAKIAITYDDGLTEEQAEEAAKKAKEAEEEKKAAEKKATPPEDEPQWGSAPVKREPTVTSDFGKSEKAEKPAREKAEKTAKEKPAREKSEKPAREKREPAETESEEEKQNASKKEHVLPTQEQIEFTQKFMDGLVTRMGIEGSVEITVDDGMRINVNTEDSRVIGHRGEVLDSIQQVVSSLINTSHDKYIHITVDGLGYRGRRKETLEAMAKRMADKAVRTHRKVTLDSMNSADRRIIHSALGERTDVFTRSEGHEPARRVAIIPKRRGK